MNLSAALEERMDYRFLIASKIRLQMCPGESSRAVNQKGKDDLSCGVSCAIRGQAVRVSDRGVACELSRVLSYATKRHAVGAS